LEPTTAAVGRSADPGIRATWTAYAYLSVWGYVLYGLGNATPYLRADLALTDFQAGLHASALAVGVLMAGVTADQVARWVGTRWLLDLAVACLVLALGLVVLAPNLPVSLSGALLIGFGGGLLGTDINVRLIRPDGVETRRVMGQANALSMVTAAAAPVAIGLAVAGLHAWRLALLVPVAAFLALALIRPRASEARSSVRPPRMRLPAAYWFAWLVLVLGVSIEFSFVFWGSTIVANRTGLSSADATLLASLFVAGMFTGRAAVGRGFGAGRAPRGILAAGLVVVLVGASLVWVSPLPVVSGIGLFVGGLGLAPVWPVGLTVALQSAPAAPLSAAARSTLASGTAVLLAPSALGLASDFVGVAGAWPIILALGCAALAVLAVTPRPASTT
jgi:predicted MFS family arabinose efflux permease